ncbi:Hypothetical protein POVR1_LOCUS386 [uncultured virus]|nr:Hypothetical protein POVR1_LOCUS386 [uncultured virus]
MDSPGASDHGDREIVMTDKRLQFLKFIVETVDDQDRAEAKNMIVEAEKRRDRRMKEDDEVKQNPDCVLKPLAEIQYSFNSSPH